MFHSREHNDEAKNLLWFLIVMALHSFFYIRGFLQVKENSVNVIFAVTEEQFDVYNMLQANIEGSSAGTLSADSSNIVELVKAQYQVIESK